MFNKAKIQLTTWYLIIIMLFSLSFSIFVYSGVNNATKRALEAQKIRLERRLNEEQMFPRPFRNNQALVDEETIIEIRKKTITLLVFMNAGVVIIAGGLGYFLAGKTLQPIESAHIKQKRFISDAAHELKTPLTAMKTEMEVSLRDPGFDKQMAKETISASIEEIDKLNNLVSDLLTKVKYELNHNLEKLELIDLSQIISHVVKKLKPLADKEKQIIETELKSLTVRASNKSMEELFTNLIENAIKYNKNSGKVTIKIFEQSKYAVVEICDEGIGINPKDLDNIFEPFYRSDESRNKNKHNGFGLGLSIAKEIVQNNMGTISVISNLNEGSVFTVKLPKI